MITAILIAAMTLAAGSCSSKAELQGEWKIVSVGTDNVGITEAPPTLSFDTETGRVHGYTGVNIVNGSFTQEGRKLTLSDLGVTMMAGPAEDMALERKILDAFNNVRKAKTSEEGNLLLLNDEDEVIVTLARR